MNEEERIATGGGAALAMTGEAAAAAGMTSQSAALTAPLSQGSQTTARTLAMVTAEIRSLDEQAKRLMLGHAIEIGRRLKEAKELVPYGEWGDYIEHELSYSQSTANNFMRIFEEYGAAQQSLFGPVAESQTLGNLSYTKALKLLAVPREEREDFAVEVDAEHLSTRELAQAIKERDEARKTAEAMRGELEGAELAISDAEAQRDEAREALAELKTRSKEQRDEDRDTIRTLEAKITELESRPVDVAVQEPDPAEVEKRAAELAKAAREEAAAANQTKDAMKASLAAAEKKAAEDLKKAKAKAAEDLSKAKLKAAAERTELEAKLKEAEDKLAAAGTEDKNEAEKLRAEAEALRKQLAMSGQEVVIFKLRFSAWQEAHRQMTEAFAALQDEETKEKMRKAIAAQVKAWGYGE